MSASDLHGGRVHEAARRFNRSPENFIDFSSNMNVLAPPIAADDWARWLSETQHYPEDSDLRNQLAEVYEMPAEWILPTAGAIEAIYLAARLFAGKRVAVIEPGFGDYSRALGAAGAQVESKPWRSILEDDLQSFDAVILGNPNNPTGTLTTAHDLLALNARALLVDEAFIEFAAVESDDSLLPALASRHDIIVFRSLTKSWRIPGLRLGFLATANHDWLARVRAVQPPWSINSITAAWARKYLTLEHYRSIRKSLRSLPKLREEFHAQLASIPGIIAHPGAANFFLIELKAAGLSASELFDALARRGFLVRVCDSFHGLKCGRFLRVAVRTEKENALFANALAEVVAVGAEPNPARIDTPSSTALAATLR